MLLFTTTSFIALHVFIAWVLVEVFVNNAHRLARKQYIFLHYASIIFAFAGVFFLYFQFFSKDQSVFFVTATAMSVLFLIELIVFGLLYSEERWFLNYVDWIIPMFLVASTIYFVGKLV